MVENLNQFDVNGILYFYYKNKGVMLTTHYYYLYVLPVQGIFFLLNSININYLIIAYICRLILFLISVLLFDEVHV